MRKSHKNKPLVRIGIIIVLASLLMLQAPGLQASAQSDNSFDDWVVYENEECGFSFQYPPDSFDLDDQGDSVRVGLSIMSGTNLIEKYVDITCSTDSTSRDLNLPSVGEISNINVNGIDFQVQSGGEAGAGNLYQATKYSTQKENQYISLTFVLHSENGSGSGLPEFDKAERDVFEEIMSTFKFSLLDSSPASPPASPNFEGQIAYVGVDGNVYLIRGDTGQTRQVTNDATTQEYYVGPAFDPNGENIAFVKSNSAGQGPLFIFNTNNLDLRKITDQAENRFQWYPDGSKLGYVQDGALFTFSLNDSNSQKALDDIAYFSWSPTGEKIIYTKYSDRENPCKGSYILDYQSQNLVKIEDGKGYSFGDWSPDGQWIVTVIACYEFGGMAPINAETGQMGDVFTSITSWSPDGTKFTGQTGGGYGSETSPEPIFSGLESSTTKIIHGNVAAEWSPKEENLIATYGNDGFYFLLPDTQTYQKILDKEVTSVYWSPFGQQLLLIGAQPETTDNLMPSELMVYDKESNSMLLDNVFAGSKDGKVYVAWGKLSQAQTSYNISGNVSLSDQSPLPGVSIWVDGAQITTTDQSGNFRIDGISAGQHSIEPRLDGYSFTPQSQQIDVQGDIGDLQFVGQPSTGYTIAGRVEDSNGLPLAGVSINLDNNPSVLTGDDGRYRIENLAPRTYTLGASLGGYKFHPEPFTFNLDKDKLNFDFRGYEPNPLAVQLIALEVTQGLQDLDNNVPLVAGRPTYVRAYVTSSQTMSFSATLIIRTADGKIYEQKSKNPIDIKSGITPDDSRLDEMRKDLNSTLYFEIPSNVGKLELELKPETGSLQCSIPKGCPVRVEFKYVAPLEINVFPVVTNNSSNIPTYSDLQNSMVTVKDYLPVAVVDYKIRLDTVTDVGLDWWKGKLQKIIWDLDQIRWIDCSENRDDCRKIYLGILNPAGLKSTDYQGLMDPSVKDVAVGYWLGGSPGSNQNGIIPHEIAHTFNIRHTITLKTLGGSTCPDPKYRDNSQPPYQGLSPEINGRSAAYGISLDVMRRIMQDPQKIDASTIIPANTADLMSYCPTRWPSESTYTRLLFGINEKFSNLMVPQDFAVINRSLQSDNEKTMLLISGIIGVDANTTKIVSIYSVKSKQPVSQFIDGDYMLQVEDDLGKILVKASFTPELLMDQNEELSFFHIPVIVPSQPHKVLLLHNNEVVAEILASLNSPNVKIVFPNGGEVWSGDSVRAEWQASDDDNDPLQYVVQISFDNGQTWRTEAVNLTDTKLDLHLEFMPGAKQALLRVLASDGFYTAQDTSDTPFTISGHNPSANISSPINGREYDANQLVILYGDAYDAENGMLSDSALEWSSDRNGILGTGQVLTVKAGTLQPDTHTITLTAIDQDGNTAQSSIQVIIKATEDKTIIEPSGKISPVLLYGGIAFVGILMVGLFGLVAVIAWRHKPSPKRPTPVDRTAVATTPPVNNPSVPSVATIEKQVNAAIELSQTGKYQESFAILKELVKVEPNNTQAWLYLGVDLVYLKDFVSAERCLQRAKKLGHPKADQALEWLKKKEA